MTSSMEIFRRLRAHARSSVQPEDLHALAVRIGFDLPATMKELYRLSNGFDLEAMDLTILSLQEVEQAIAAFREFGIPTTWNYAPFTNSSDSNPFCVCCSDILHGYVVRVFHDDAAQLMFRDLSSFLDALAALQRQGLNAVDAIQSEFNLPYRSERDSRTAETLLALANNLDGVAKDDAITFAITLLPDYQIELLEGLLEEEGEHVRTAALARLREIGTDRAVSIIQAYEHEMRSFVERCAEALVRAGLQATVATASRIRLDPGPVWLNMEAFYRSRREPDIVNTVVESAQRALARTPHARHWWKKWW